jgi:hypothetical protein
MLLKIKHKPMLVTSFTTFACSGQRTHTNAQTPKRMHAKHQQYPFPICLKKILEVRKKNT